MSFHEAVIDTGVELRRDGVYDLPLGVFRNATAYRNCS
jgi:hypothetical protein